MPLLLWRLLTLLLAALSMALSFCHLMEMPVRLTWAPALWMATTNFGGLYYLFGNVGAVIDVSVIVAAAIPCALTRRRHPSFHLTILGALLMATGLGAWFAFVAPMARRMGSSWVAAGEAGRRSRATGSQRTDDGSRKRRTAGRTDAPLRRRDSITEVTQSVRTLQLWMIRIAHRIERYGRHFN